MDCNHSLLPRACDFAREMLDAALENTLEGNLDPILSEHPHLKSVYDNLFDTVLPQLSLHTQSINPLFDLRIKKPARRKRASETTQELEVTDKNNVPLIKHIKTPTWA